VKQGVLMVSTMGGWSPLLGGLPLSN